MRAARESCLRSLTAAAAVGLWAICAQPAAAQMLAETLAKAYATNPTLRAARAELRAVNEGVPQALSNWRPNLTVTGTAGKQHINSQASFSTTKEITTPTTGTVRLIQPLYRGGRTIAATARAEHEVRAQRSALQSVEQSVLLRAVTAYMDVWRDQAVIAFNVKNEQVIARQLEATRDRFTVGEVTRTDVAQSETRLAVAAAERIAAEGALRSSRAVYAEVVGNAPGVLLPPGPLEGLPASLEAVVDQAVSRNPDVLAANFAEKAARRRVREVIGELLPSVQINASLSRSEETSQKAGETDRAQILAEITIPLYQQGAVSSRVREAKQIANQRRIEIEESRRRIQQEAISAWEGLATARARIRSFESGVRSAEIALEGVRQENAVGARTILDILDAEQELLDAQVSLVRSQRDEIIAGYQVHAAMGRLTARDLNLAVVVYNPEVDYLKVRNSWFNLGGQIAGEE
ncbi:MAG: TolC family outer membrane protein [Proteobacteria bacterium]|nr:TolC family outer membrane protein [Pseudomonadota bacterium]